MLYLLVSLIVVIVVAAWAGRRARSRFGWGFGAALMMYNLVFWDWIPTVYVHKYYCEKEAGFWVYKTLDQWKAENPGVMEGLHQILQPSQKTSYGDVDILDERFAIETHRRKPVPQITTSIAERRLVDRKTGEILVKTIDVGSGNTAVGGGLQFWLKQVPCISENFWGFVKQLGQMRGTE